MHCYQASGRYNPLTLVVGFALVLAVALLAWPYQLILDILPFAYLNFLITVGFAIVIGYVVMWTLKLSRCRSMVVALAIGTVIGLSAVWTSHYWSYVRWTNNYASYEEVQEATPGVDGAAVRTELSLLDYLPERAAEGREVKIKRVWIPLTGIAVYGYWFVEALMLGAGGVWGAWMCIGTPFCESCNEWCDREEMDVAITGIGREAVHRVAEADTLEQILSIGSGGDKGSPHELHYKVHLCRTCSSSAYLSIVHHEVTKDEKEKEKTVKRDLFKNIALGRKELKAMRGFKKLMEGAAKSGTPA